MGKIAAVFIPMLALCGVMVASASASEPVVIEKANQLTRHFEGLTDCQAFGYDFTFTGDFQVTRTVTQFYSQDGTLLREVRQIRFLGTETNDLTGKSIPVNGVRHITLDFVNGTFTETGVLRRVTVPGEGIVLHESGRVVTGLEDETLISESGPHELLHGDLAAYCAVLADP